MKFLVFLSMVFLHATSFAFDPSQATQEFDYDKFSEDDTRQAIYEEMSVSCNKGLCSIFAHDEYKNVFVVSFRTGFEDQDPEEDVIDVGPFIGLEVSYTKSNCTQKVLIPKPLFIAVNTYFYDLLDEDGNTRENFHPSDEAIITLYTTIMKQIGGC